MKCNAIFRQLRVIPLLGKLPRIQLRLMILHAAIGMMHQPWADKVKSETGSIVYVEAQYAVKANIPHPEDKVGRQLSSYGRREGQSASTGR